MKSMHPAIASTSTSASASASTRARRVAELRETLTPPAALAANDIQVIAGGGSADGWDFVEAQPISLPPEQ